MVTLKAHYPLAVLLEVAGLARSTFFYHQARLDRPDPHARLKQAVTDVFQQAHGRYGHRRVHAMLHRHGLRPAKKTVLHIMRTLGLACTVRRRRRYSSWKGEAGTTAGNVLDRDFTAPAPNTKWVTDITELRVGTSKIYLSPIIDLFDRSVVSYSWSTRPDTHLTNSSLTKAIATLNTGHTPLVHTDQGFHYRHTSWRQLLHEANLTPSMSRKATCLDNAVAENFFSHLKEELFHHHNYNTPDEFTTALENYLDWYNTTRISTTLKNLTPTEYRAQALTT
ncbi:IS3 family transposase [Saccharopolyspora gloriosae]|uniref:IS3 family transposase n=1 Tax=Saccharopolyspora gloriosae TaxID=455344 RepID=UPI001FB85A40|nr:IS3 family transposase [Saccharopolyspora gloriosae]